MLLHEKYFAVKKIKVGGHVIFFRKGAPLLTKVSNTLDGKVIQFFWQLKCRNKCPIGSQFFRTFCFIIWPNPSRQLHV